MRPNKPILLPLALLVPAAVAAGCAAGGSSAYSAGTSQQQPPPQTNTPDTSGARAIQEADIIQLDDAAGLLYAMSRSGTVSIVDVATPGQLWLLGQTTLPGEPFEMYRRGDYLIAMSKLVTIVRGAGPQR